MGTYVTRLGNAGAEGTSGTNKGVPDSVTLGDFAGLIEIGRDTVNSREFSATPPQKGRFMHSRT